MKTLVLIKEFLEELKRLNKNIEAYLVYKNPPQPKSKFPETIGELNALKKGGAA